MTSVADLTAWVTRIYENWNETGVAVSRGVTWFQNNLYRINSALETGFYMSGDYIVPEMTQAASGVYEEMYYCDYLSKKGNQAIGAHAYDWTVIEGEKQGMMRKVSRNEVAKTYLSMTKDCRERLDLLVEWYLDQSSSYPLAAQILYNDRGTVADFGLLNFHAPPTHYYSENNTIWLT